MTETVLHHRSLTTQRLPCPGRHKMPRHATNFPRENRRRATGREMLRLVSEGDALVTLRRKVDRQANRCGICNSRREGYKRLHNVTLAKAVEMRKTLILPAIYDRTGGIIRRKCNLIGPGPVGQAKLIY